MSFTPAYLSEAWRETFPSTDVALALRFMHDTWVKLVTQFPDAIHPVKCSEPQITQNFGEHLQVDGAASALSGIFDYEVPKASRDPVTGKRIRTLRTDILYQDSAVRFSSGKRLSLIFEFKKLKNTSDSRSAYVGKKGMQRFISGYYQSHADHLAFMVGLVYLDVAKTVSGLESRLKQDAIRTQLHIQPNGDGNYVRKPSEWFKDSVNFDTLHSRTLFGDLSDLTICHFFLEH
jgi:hypothetical protein